MKKLLSVLFIFSCCSLFADSWDDTREQLRLEKQRVENEIQAKKREALRVEDDVDAKKREAWRVEEQRLEQKRVQDEVVRRKLESDRVQRARLDAQRNR